MKTYLILFGIVAFLFLDLMMVPDLISDSDSANVWIGITIIVMQLGFVINFITRKIKGVIR